MTTRTEARDYQLAELRGRVIAVNDAYLEGVINRRQRATRLMHLAYLGGYDRSDMGVAALITDLLDPR